jgi:hypothetical protein
MGHRFGRIALLLAAAAAAACLAGCESLERAAFVPASFVSHQMCSGVFVAGRNPDEFYREAVEPQVAPAGFLLRHTIDWTDKTVTATFSGLVTARALYRGPTGCLIQHGAPPEAAVPDIRPETPDLLPPNGEPDVVAPADPALSAALDRAFAEPDSPPHRRSKAVLIVRDGRTVAERYAPGYGVDTPMLGWSMTKSVTNALIGILVREGRLKVDAPAPIAGWSATGDPRHAITIDNLLRMTSGIDFGQSLTADWTSAFDPSAQMNFDQPDMAAFAERAPLSAAPGQKWTYTNGNTMLLSRIVRDQAGGDPASVLRFAHHALFDKLGMRHVTLEFDGAGTPIGSSLMWASARDWARFGLLYLNDGVVAGERILPPGWVDYSAAFTPGSEDYGYGAGFWTNRGTSPAARRRVAAGMPADSFMARGSQGQYVIIVPSERLVVVRLGFSYTPLGDVAAVERLVADTVAALRRGGPGPR